MAQLIIKRIRTIAPYIALELLMPGGTMLAFLLFLHRRKRGIAQRSGEANTAAMMRGTTRGTLLAASP
jgi:hypothetical protein